MNDKHPQSDLAFPIRDTVRLELGGFLHIAQ